MKLKLFLGLLIVSFSFMTLSCSSDDDRPEQLSELKFELLTEIKDNAPIILASEGTFKLLFESEHAKSVLFDNVPAGWDTQINNEESSIEITAPGHHADGQGGLLTLTLKAKGDGNQEVRREIELYWIKTFDDPKGTFVLNEGNMTSENGSLMYITPEGFVIDNAYKLVNGTELGNVCQDMSVRAGKIYVISQNGEKNATGTALKNDGMLVVMDAKTLKKEKSFLASELPELTWPSHIAALDPQHVYIRDNGAADGDNGKGKIWKLNTETGSLTAIEGTEGAPKSPLVTMDDKVYTFKSTFVSAYAWELSKDQNSVKRIQFPWHWKSVEGIQAGSNGQLWVMASTYGSQLISKFDLATKKVVVKKNISHKLNSGSSGLAFVAKDDLVYYAFDTSIYRLSFEDNKTTSDTAPLEAVEMVDVLELDTNAREFYNGLGVHPVTGHVYVNSIKGVGGFYTTNQVWVFDFMAKQKEPVFKFEDYTKFPAGVFFTR